MNEKINYPFSWLEWKVYADHLILEKGPFLIYGDNSIKNIFYDKMGLRLFYFHVTTQIFDWQQTGYLTIQKNALMILLVYHSRKPLKDTWLIPDWFQQGMV